MKKILLAVFTAGLLSVSAMAANITGQVTKIGVLNTGDVKVSIDGSAAKIIENDNVNKKEWLAMLLTAKSTTSTVILTVDTGIVSAVYIQ